MYLVLCVDNSVLLDVEIPQGDFSSVRDRFSLVGRVYGVMGGQLLDFVEEVERCGGGRKVCGIV